MQIIIPALLIHKPIMKISIRELTKQIPNAKFLIVTPNKKDFVSLKSFNIEIKEDKDFTSVSIACVKKKLSIKKTNLAKWYYQQFLKYSIVAASAEPQVLLIDADTIPINTIICPPNSFFTSKESSTNYRKHFRALFLVDAPLKKSSIVNFMWFQPNFLREMLKQIKVLHNKEWWDAIIDIDNSLKIDNHSFSEYETYANWFAVFKSQVREIPIHIFRRGDLLVDIFTDYKKIFTYVRAKGYSSIAFEHNHRSNFFYKVSVKVILFLGIKRW